MELKIIEQKENPLLNRIELKIEIRHQGEPTPTREKAKEQIAAMLSVEKQLVVVKKIAQTYSSISKTDAVVYKTLEDLKKSEPEYLLKRGAKVRINGEEEKN